MRKKEFQRIMDFLSRLAEIESSLQEMQDDEQEKFDNMPDSLQSSSRGEEFEDIIDCLGDAITGVEDAVAALERLSDLK